jgi:hypothetical protein
MRTPAFRRALFLLPLLAAVALTACHGKADRSQPGGGSPEAAVRTSIDLLRAGDFNDLWKHALPPADYATLRADWLRHQQAMPPLTAEDRARFDKTLQQLTEPDAQAKLFAEVLPKLVTMQQQYSDQLPVLISVGEALVNKAVAGNDSLSADQKSQAASVLDVLTPWAQQTPWFDQDRAKRAIGIVVATARSLNLKTPEQLRSMDFDTTMAKYALGFAGAKQLLAVYGLSIDDTLQSVKLTPISSGAGHAVVRIDYTLLGKPLSTEAKLVQQDGRWYSQDLVDNVRASHRQLSQPAPSPSVSASAAAAAASTIRKD